MNAYYSPDGKFCFGYFESPAQSEFPGTLVFTSLSQDIIAHELTHAILFGMGVEFGEENPDVAAFHEAFADLVPLFQHFWKSEEALDAIIGESWGAILTDAEDSQATVLWEHVDLEFPQPFLILAEPFGTATGEDRAVVTRVARSDGAGQGRLCIS